MIVLSLLPFVFVAYGLSFVPLEVEGGSVFAFPEFLTALALMVLAWTTADARYRFRVQAAPVALYRLSYFVVASIGVLTLLTDLWRAERWPVLSGTLISPAEWQALLGAVLLATFLAWSWFAFIRPVVFSKWNAKQYYQALYRFVLRGSPSELAIIVDEVSRSASAVVALASAPDPFKGAAAEHAGNAPTRPSTADYADAILSLIADRRFCRAISAASPVTALELFRAISETGRYRVRISQFAANITAELMANKDSLLYHESQGYNAGLLGVHQPLSSTLYGNYPLVESVPELLDPGYRHFASWDAEQWAAYCHAVSLTLKDYVARGDTEVSRSLSMAMRQMERASADLYRLNGGAAGSWRDDSVNRLDCVARFVEDAIAELSKGEVPTWLRWRTDRYRTSTSVFDALAELAFELLADAATVRSPQDLSWHIQQHTAWSRIMNPAAESTPAAQVVHFKIRRLVYDEIAEMAKMANFQGARLLALCLNVLGFELPTSSSRDAASPLHLAVLRWTKRHFIALHASRPDLGDACLPLGVHYDRTGQRLVRTHPVISGQGTPRYTYLDL